MLKREMSSANLLVVSSLASKEAPQSSSQGMDSYFNGATFILAVTRDNVGGPSVYVALT